MAKSDRIVVRLDVPMRARLHEKASALGLDDAAYVRMLIYAEVNGVDRDAGNLVRAVRSHTQADLDSLRRGIGDRADGWGEPDALSGPEPLPVEAPGLDPGVDVPADADAGASLLDEMEALLSDGRSMAASAPPAPRPSLVANGGRPPFRPPYRPRGYGFGGARAAQPFYGPGSMTQAIGLGDGTAGNVPGDYRGNVMRDNFAHFGFVGTRSR